ncbi:MAG: glycerophosphodiester phosphodiesterase [Actinobacteria bacterium]|nr:glycerophosphodiester phosphodiesterase [Actinomycetota bacterium]
MRAPGRKVTVCAHRGASGTHPENTLAALQQAVALGCEMVEFDVRCSADRVPVLLHDATVERTSDGTGPVSNLTLAELKRLDVGAWHAPAFAGERMPALDEALDVLPPEVELNIHVQDGDGDASAAHAVSVAIVRRGRLDSAFVAALARVLAGVRAFDPRIRCCLLGHAQLGVDYLGQALAQRCYALQPLARLTTPELCAAAHAVGLRVHPFYADDPDEMRRLIACGVDGILTNYPGRLQAVRAALDSR